MKPNGPISPELAAQLGECVLWDGRISHNGYARYRMPGTRTDISATKMLWESEHGPLPAELELHHRCLTRACVRLDHLKPVTRAEHRQIHAAMTTHCPKGHEYTEENTENNTGDNGKHCRTCRRDRERVKKP